MNDFEELYESYLNGNITHVLKELKKKTHYERYAFFTRLAEKDRETYIALSLLFLGKYNVK